MKNNIKSIFTVFFIIALIAAALSGIFLVLDIGESQEIKEALEKAVYVLGILAALSLAVMGVTRLNK